MKKTDYTCTCGHALDDHNRTGTCRALECECLGYVPVRGRRELAFDAWIPGTITYTSSDGMTDEVGRPITWVPIAVLNDLVAEVDDLGGKTIVRGESNWANIELDDGALMLAGLAYIDSKGSAARGVHAAIRAYLWALANTSDIPGFGEASPSYRDLQRAMKDDDQ